MIPITFAAAGDGAAFLIGTIVVWAIVASIVTAFAPHEKALGIFLLTFFLGPIGFVISVAYMCLFCEAPKPLDYVPPPPSKNDYDKELKHKLHEFYNEQRYYYGLSDGTLEWLRTELAGLRADVMRALYRNSADSADRVLYESLNKLRAACAAKEPFSSAK